MSIYGKIIENEMKEKYGDIDIPELSSEELRIGWEDLCRRIREKYGKDVI